MDVRDLQYFLAVAELGHLGRAAKTVFRSQPALSKSIHRLEESLDVKLFDRVGRGIRLTPVGAAVGCGGAGGRGSRRGCGRVAPDLPAPCIAA